MCNMLKLEKKKSDWNYKINVNRKVEQQSQKLSVTQSFGSNMIFLKEDS